MNTKAAIERLTLAVCERLGLTLVEVVDVQVDLAHDYLKTLVEAGFLGDAADAELLALLPEFWGWWRQRWANQDRYILERVTPLDLLEWRTRGCDLHQVYADYCQPLGGLQEYPNAVIMAAFDKAKQQQNRAYAHLKNLFQTT
jgi:hypothetical protein